MMVSFGRGNVFIVKYIILLAFHKANRIMYHFKFYVSIQALDDLPFF